MNKEKVYLEGYVVGHTADTLGYKGLMVQLENLDVVEIDKNLVHKDINKPQKPVIPQFVADLIEEARIYEWDLDDLFEHISEDSGESEVSIWFYTLGNVDVLARAWLDGYTVDEEKRYRVRIKGVYHNSCLIFDKINKKWFLSSIFEIDYQMGSHTRKQLDDAGFGWVFDCPGIEIEEVEE